MTDERSRPCTDPSEGEKTSSRVNVPDALAEVADDLRLQEFEVQEISDASFAEDEGFPELRVDSIILSRILDNILSNIVRYADRSQPVFISIACEDDDLRVAFKNSCRRDVSGGTGLGIPGISSEMAALGGSASVDQTGDTFRIELSFPVK